MPKPAGAVAIVAMQPCEPQQQDLGLRRLRDAERPPAERLPQLVFKHPPLAVRLPGKASNQG
jgi:hypothetical protein